MDFLTIKSATRSTSEGFGLGCLANAGVGHNGILDGLLCLP